jgi:DNA-directed RNA polymerase subunit RPC12/RpoP
MSTEGSQPACPRCGVTLFTLAEVRKKYTGESGIFLGSMQDLAQAERDRDAIGVTCAKCGASFCSACMTKLGKRHPISGGLACLDCGGRMKQFARS